ncbi:MAG: cytochrome C [Bacteroidia bacterium]|nr:cytochrome C [Bacteroidia bacterium]
MKVEPKGIQHVTQVTFRNLKKSVLTFTLGLLVLTACVKSNSNSTEGEEKPLTGEEVVDGIDVSTGFVAEGDYKIVKANCLGCHSSKLILQNRATREGWEEMIRWMQETQKLHDLGPMEDKILDYLASHYAPKEEGRRKTLEVEEWYVIE